MPGQVIPSRQWRHTNGRAASIYGAVPWTSESEKDSWSIVNVGFTIQHPDGTVGLGRAPFATEAEAQAWVDAHPTFSGMQQD